MELLTALIVAIATPIMWRSTPQRALSIWMGSTLLYPQFLALNLGPASFNTGRILILVLFAKMFLQSRLVQEMRWTTLDRLVVFGLFGKLMALAFNVPPLQLLEREAGFILTIIMPYFAIRMIVRSRDDFKELVRALVVSGVILAVLGVYQTATGHNPMGFMKAYNAFNEGAQRMLNRYGLYRADVSFGQYIAFGMFFTMVVPLSLTLRMKEVSPFLSLVMVGTLTAGMVSSMSSAPFLAFYIVIAILMWYPFRNYTPLLIVMSLFFVIFLEFYSNRHFYEVLSRMAMNSTTAAYRVGLVEEAFGGGMDGHWLFGYGYVGIGPGNDNSHFHWKHQDFVNVYIARLATTGLVGLLPFMWLNVLFYQYLWRAWKVLPSQENRWIIWCLTATLLSWNASLMTVNTVSHLQMLLYMLVALIGSLYVWSNEEAKALDEQSEAPEEEPPEGLLEPSPQPLQTLRSDET